MTLHAFWRALLLVYLGVFLRSFDPWDSNVMAETMAGPALTNPLTPCSSKDLQHVFIVPTARAAFHGHTVLIRMLLQEGQRKAIEPGEVFTNMLVTDT